MRSVPDLVMRNIHPVLQGGSGSETTKHGGSIHMPPQDSCEDYPYFKVLLLLLSLPPSIHAWARARAIT